MNPDATTDCQYCQYTDGNQFLASLNVDAGDKWRNFGVFLVFVLTNWLLVYFFIWSVRIKGWGFGFGYIFGFLGKVVDGVKKPLVKRFGKKQD